jgi:two-component system, LytTR family, response regulator
MRGIRSLIIDDEEAARQRLRRLLQVHPEIDIVGEASDGIEALDAIERLWPQLLFLDIQMPGLTGFEVLRNLPAGVERPLIIFVTGYHEHALEAFRARAIAYLLKPVEEDHLAEMIDRARRLLNSSHSDADEANLDGLLRENGRIAEQMVGRKANRIVLLDPSEALFFYMDAGIVRVHMEHDTYWVNYQLGELEEALAGRGFFRTHRSSLVNLKRVKEIRSGIRGSLILVMADSQSTEVEVSNRQGRALRERIPGL